MYAMIISSIGLMFLTVGVTYSFFNYTKTGGENTLGTGRIYFNTTEGTALNMTNMFPMTSQEAAEANLDTVTVGITGDTTYPDGEEFEISLVDVTNTVNNKEVPINFIATYTVAPGGNIGTSSDTYYTARNSKDATIYKLTSTGQVEEGKRVLVGYIDNGATGISGTLSIKAYIDADRMAITDTYNGPSSTPTDSMGTTGEWVDDRTVFTTTEWNSLSSGGVSFKIKAESQEGVWVTAPSSPTPTPTITPTATPVQMTSCDDCQYMFVEDVDMFMVGNTSYGNPAPTVITSGLYANYQDLINVTNKNYFLGVKRNSSNQVTNAYACGVKNNELFCIEGTPNGAQYASNNALLQKSSLWNGTCTSYTQNTPYQTRCESVNGSVQAINNSNGIVSVGNTDYYDCFVTGLGEFGCHAGM